jgi:hypothetical protein
MLVKLLRPNKNPEVVRYLRKLVFTPIWGWKHAPEQAVLLSVVDFASLVPGCIIKICPWGWRIEDDKAETVRNFVKLAMTIRQAMRTKNKRRMPGCDKAVRLWLAGSTVQEMDRPNLKFFPIDGCPDVVNKVMAACATTTIRAVLSWYGVKDGLVGTETQILADILCWEHEDI